MKWARQHPWLFWVVAVPAVVDVVLLVTLWLSDATVHDVVRRAAM